jgi:hypothetical protein
LNDFKDEIEEARAKVAQLRIRAERPGSRLEDDFALEKARTRLLTLELRQLRQGAGASGGTRENARMPSSLSRRGRLSDVKRTKSEQNFRSVRERAEEAFSALQRQPLVKKEQG